MDNLIKEQIKFKINDIDFETRTMRIRGKGDKDRIVLFDEECRNLLEEYLKLKRKNVIRISLFSIYLYLNFFNY